MELREVGRPPGGRIGGLEHSGLDVDHVRLDAQPPLVDGDAAREHLSDPEPGRGLDVGEPLPGDQEVEELLRVHLHAREVGKLRVEAVAQRLAHPGVLPGVAKELEEHHPEHQAAACVRGGGDRDRRSHRAAGGHLVADHHHRHDRERGEGSGAAHPPRDPGPPPPLLGFPRHDQVGVHGLRDVLELLAPEVDELLVEPVVHVPMDAVGNADRPRAGERLQAGGDVDRVTEGVALAQEQIAVVDPDAQLEAPPVELLDREAPLDLEGGVDRRHHAVEGGKQRVPGHRLGMPLGLGYDPPDEAMEVLDCPCGALVVLAHERAEPAHVGEQHGAHPPGEHRRALPLALRDGGRALLRRWDSRRAPLDRFERLEQRPFGGAPRGGLLRRDRGEQSAHRLGPEPRRDRDRLGAELLHERLVSRPPRHDDLAGQALEQDETPRVEVRAWGRRLAAQLLGGGV